MADESKVMTMTKTHAKTKTKTKTMTKTKWLKDPTCAIFSKMIWLNDVVKYDIYISKCISIQSTCVARSACLKIRLAWWWWWWWLGGLGWWWWWQWWWWGRGWWRWRQTRCHLGGEEENSHSHFPFHLNLVKNFIKKMNISKIYDLNVFISCAQTRHWVFKNATNQSNLILVTLETFDQICRPDLTNQPTYLSTYLQYWRATNGCLFCSVITLLPEILKEIPKEIP